MRSITLACMLHSKGMGDVNTIEYVETISISNNAQVVVDFAEVHDCLLMGTSGVGHQRKRTMLTS